MSANSSRVPPVEVRVTHRFRASAQRVFDAWLDPGTAVRWLFATAWHPMAGVRIDARAGGSFRFDDQRNGEGIVQAGRYIEIARPRRLVFTLSGQRRSRDLSRVIVEIASVGSGCELTLVHESVLPDRASHIEGRWAGMLYGLGTILGRSTKRGLNCERPLGRRSAQ